MRRNQAKGRAKPAIKGGYRPDLQVAFLAPRFWATWLLFMLCGLLAVVPDALRAGIGHIAAALVWRIPSRRRHIARTNLDLCFPQLPATERERILRRHLEIVVQVFLRYGQLMFGSPRALVCGTDVEGLEHFDEATAGGRGVILLACHQVALEHAGQWLALHRETVSVVRLHVGNELLDWIVSRMRNRYGGRFIGHQDGMLPLVKAVRAGAWLYYLPDEDPRMATADFAPFYGVPKATTATLGRLADTCNAVVLPMASGYSLERRRFWLRFLPAEGFHASDDPQLDARRTNALIEKIIAVDPAQYMWSNKLFRTRPPGSDKPY